MHYRVILQVHDCSVDNPVGAEEVTEACLPCKTVEQELREADAFIRNSALLLLNSVAGQLSGKDNVVPFKAVPGVNNTPYGKGGSA